MRGKGTTDAIFIVRQLLEKGFLMAFDDFAKAFGLVGVEVPRR